MSDEPRSSAGELEAGRDGLRSAETERFEAGGQAGTDSYDRASLLRRIVTAQEDERARIARDLHDHLGQQLTALRLTLHRIREQHSPEAIDRALALAAQMDRDLHFLAWDLRPAVLDDGLGAALRQFVHHWSEYHGIPTEYRETGYAARALGPDTELVFYRVAQEALNNAAKHAHASRVDVLLEARDGRAVLVIEDNGVGFDPSARSVRDKGIGLAGMQERAGLAGGTLDLESSPRGGTVVRLRASLGAEGGQDP